jgi:putative transposase
VPRLGWVKCFENLRFTGKINNVVISKRAGNYYASINLVTEDVPSICENQTVVGVDLGIKTLATLSNGVTFENPKAYKHALKTLKRLQRSLSRKIKGSNNRKKAITKLAKRHFKVVCIRKNAIHQLTKYLVTNFGIIVIEDLQVKNMIKNRKLSEAISDASFGEFKQQLVYKSSWHGVQLILADKFFPSSKICSCCGAKKEILKLSERTYNCINCGTCLDRDLNAAKNLANLALPGKSGEVKLVEQTQMLDLSDRVAVKQESLFINKLNN